MKKPMVITGIIFLMLLVPSVSVVKDCSALITDDLPASFSWCDINGTDYTTPIRDQSPAPTCEAFAFCAALETEMQYKLRERYLPDLSENHLYFNAGGTIVQGYVDLTDAANYLMQYGVPDEGCFPDPHRAFDYPYYSLPGWENRTVKISEWGWVDHNITTMKHALIDHGPLIICIHFWRDFFFTPGKIYKHHNGQPVGGHVVAIVGYDDTLNC
jgi:C1A family cysteine protease